MSDARVRSGETRGALKFMIGAALAIAGFIMAGVLHNAWDVQSGSWVSYVVFGSCLSPAFVWLDRVTWKRRTAMWIVVLWLMVLLDVVLDVAFDVRMHGLGFAGRVLWIAAHGVWLLLACVVGRAIHQLLLRIH